MPANWLFNFTPEMLAPLGYAAWGALIFGLVLWLFGVAIARIGVAATLGTLASGLAVFVATYFQLTVSPGTVGIVGFIAGALAGVLGFRVLQGFTLAVVLAIAVGGLYYHWHARTPDVAPIAQVPIESLKIATDNFPATPVSLHEKRHFDVAKVVDEFRRDIFALSISDQKRMVAAALGAGVIALLLAFGFPKMTTATISAVIGSLFILTAANLFMATHQVTAATPGMPGWWPAGLFTWGIMLGGLAIIGVVIQYRFFIRRSDKPQMKTA